MGLPRIAFVAALALLDGPDIGDELDRLDPFDHLEAELVLDPQSGSVSKVEMATPMGLIYEVLFPSISTFETPPERHIDPEQHAVGKQHTQKIESKPINLRTRIKRLVRRTICFSKTEYMHDLMIGLFINRYEFGRLL